VGLDLLEQLALGGDDLLEGGLEVGLGRGVGAAAGAGQLDRGGGREGLRRGQYALLVYVPTW
jgi:hypothetical protein